MVERYAAKRGALHHQRLANTMKRKTKITLTCLLAVLLTGGAIFTYMVIVPMVSMRREVKATYDHVVSADFNAVLGACREMMRTVGTNGVTEIDLIEGMQPDDRVPMTLRNMKPGYIDVEGTNSVHVVFYGGFFHLGYAAYPEGVEGGGTRKLVDGLWLLTDME